MATIKQFEDNISNLTDKEIEDYMNALNTLRGWELFEREFGYGQSLALLRQIVSHEQTGRMMEKVEKIFEEGDKAA